MAHEIEGNRAFYVKDAAWHNIGEVLDSPPETLQEAANLIHPEMLLELDVEAFAMLDGQKHTFAVPDKKSIFRADKENTYISTVGKDHPVLQASEVFDFFEPFVEHLDIEAGMVLRGGTQICALAKLKDNEIIKGDWVRSYLMFLTSYDNSTAQVTKFTGTRVVCANTLAIAMGEENRVGTWSNRHTKNLRNKVANVQSVIADSLKIADENAQAYQYLARKKVTRNQLETYIADVFMPEKEIEEVSTKLKNKLEDVIELLDTQVGLDVLPEIAGTAWQGYNAVTQYLTHEQGRNFETRLQSNIFGDALRLNTRALEYAMAM